ncbi:hypothetical protein OQA88_13494 [Cercophora sp. LCS_1]
MRFQGCRVPGPVARYQPRPAGPPTTTGYQYISPPPGFGYPDGWVLRLEREVDYHNNDYVPTPTSFRHCDAQTDAVAVGRHAAWIRVANVTTPNSPVHGVAHASSSFRATAVEFQPSHTPNSGALAATTTIRRATAPALPSVLPSTALVDASLAANSIPRGTLVANDAEWTRVQQRETSQFEPSKMALAKRTAGLIEWPVTEEERAQRIHDGVSANYHGDTSIARNRGIAGLTAHRNCAFWTTGLPPRSAVISPPESREDAMGAGANTRTSAASVVFFDFAAAWKFWNTYRHAGFIIAGYRARVVFNRVGVVENRPAPANATRVIEVRGPRDVVSEQYLIRVFEEYISFDLDEVILLNEGAKARTLGVHFGSWRTQAKSAMRMIGDRFWRFPGVRCCYGIDLCGQIWRRFG